MDIKELFEKMMDERDCDGPHMLELCEELIALARSEEEKQYLGLGLYYKAETIFRDEAVSRAALEEAVEYLNEEETPEELARCYNVLGILSCNQENFVEGIKYYIECLRLCERHDLYYVEGLCCSNIGFLFESISEYEKAINYYEQALQSFERAGTEAALHALIPSVYTNLCNCIYHLNDRTRLLTTYMKLRELAEYVEPAFIMPVFEAVYFWMVGDDEQMHRNIDKAIELAMECQMDEYCDYVDNFEFMCEFLYDNKLYRQLEQILDRLEENLPVYDNPRIRINLKKYKMACCTHNNNFEQYAKAVNEYVGLYEKITDTYHKNISESVNLQLYVNDLRDQGDAYKKDAMTDGLTLLYNRKGLDELGNQMILAAAAESKNITLLILDVDFFKEYNDYYGHVRGDECLKKIAEVIQKNVGDGNIASRFGGDEFVAVCRDMDQAQSYELAENILADVRQLKIESKKSRASSCVSLSIGVYSGNPHEGDNVRTIIEQADKMLYQAKEAGRNCYR